MQMVVTNPHDKKLTIMKSNITILMLSSFLIFACKQEVKNEKTKEVNKAEIIQSNETKHSKNDKPQNNTNCFTQNDIENLNLFFKYISSKDSAPALALIDSSNLKFKKEDISNLRKLFLSNDFDSFELKHENIDCDDYIILDIMERIKYEDDGEIHYSERNIMYKLTKKGKNIYVESAGIAG